MPKKQSDKTRPPVASPPHTPPAKLKIDREWIYARAGETDFSIDALSRALRSDYANKGAPHLIDFATRGKRGLDIREIVSLAKLLGVSVEELLRRFGVSIGTTIEEIKETAEASDQNLAAALRRLGVDIGYTVPELLARAKADGTSLVGALSKMGYDWERPRVPVIGKAEIGGRLEMIDLGTAEGPPNTTNQTRAVILEASTIGLRGAAAYFEMADMVANVAAAFHRTALLNFAGEEQLILAVIVDSPRANVYKIKPLGQDRLEDHRRLISAWPLTWVNRNYEPEAD